MSYILKTIDDQGKLTKELELKLRQAQLIAVLEDLYLPYKPKRKTRAVKAIEQGLSPLADFLLNNQNTDPISEAHNYINEEKITGRTQRTQREFRKTTTKKHEKARKKHKSEWKYVFSKIHKISKTPKNYD